MLMDSLQTWNMHIFCALEVYASVHNQGEGLGGVGRMVIAAFVTISRIL